MGSTGEPDRKRRQISSISPTTTMAKKQPFLHPSEDKKLNAAVLQYQNQKLMQKLDAQKIEYAALEYKFSQLQEKQQPYESTLEAVNKSWELLLTDLEKCSNHPRELNGGQGVTHISVTKDVDSSLLKDAFLSRLIETGATENSSANSFLNNMEEGGEIVSGKIKNILCNTMAAINVLWSLKDGLHATVLKELHEDGACRNKASSELEAQVKKLRVAMSDLHLKHKSMAMELQDCQDSDAKNKAELKHLKGELESAVAELEDNNCKLAILKAERDATKGAFFPILSVASKHATDDGVRDKQKDLQEMESVLKDLLDQASSQLLELKDLHGERIRILEQLSNLQNSLKNVKCISSSQVYLLVRDQLEKSKLKVFQYQALLEKLQVEKDNLIWREKELSMKIDVADVFRRSIAVADSRIADLGMEIQKLINDRNVIETKLDEASREPGRTEIIAEFKALVLSFPEEMGTMQHQLGGYKESASDIHSLLADVQSLSDILERKARGTENLSARSAKQVAELPKLQSMVRKLKESDMELKLILEMYRLESTDSRAVLEARDLEYKAWAQVQSLKTSLDEQNLELRVKMANEAEAISQQRLANAEAKIAELRQKLESSRSDMSRLSDVLISKTEENEAYLSEIETIGQAYDDMQTQNQQLLQQITERDDYNIKLVLEGVRTRQLWNGLLRDKQTIEREIQQANISLSFFDMKAARIEDQSKVCLDQVHKLAEDNSQSLLTLENTQKRLLDIRRSSDQARESLDHSQVKVEKSRASLLEQQLELERVRFEKSRIEEELQVVRRKISCIRAQIDESSVIEKLKQELREYREIVKCSICHDRPKEVVITKCYDLFCNPCVQRIIESRHRKCPMCASSFGPNDVKPVYI